MNKCHLTASLDHKRVSRNFCSKEAKGELTWAAVTVLSTSWSAGYCLAWPLSWNGYFLAYHFKAFIELREAPRVLKWFLCLGLVPIAQWQTLHKYFEDAPHSGFLDNQLIMCLPVCLGTCIHVPTLCGPLHKYHNMHRSMTTMGREVLVPSNGAELLIRRYKKLSDNLRNGGLFENL